jgi:hypothetical protein
MKMLEWLPAIATTTIWAAFTAALSIPFRKYVEKRLDFAFDRKIVALKAKFDRDEQWLKAQIARNSVEVEALKAAALSNLALRRADLDRRRVEAVAVLWQSVVELAPHKFAAQMCQKINFEELFTQVTGSNSTAQKTREMAAMILKMSGADEGKYNNTPATHRVFVPEIAWAMYSAYATLAPIGTLQLVTAKNGLDGSMLKASTVVAVAKKALPHQSAFIEQYGLSSVHFLLEELETLVLQELRAALVMDDSDKSTVNQAAEIMAAVREEETRHRAAGIGE